MATRRHTLARLRSLAPDVFVRVRAAWQRRIVTRGVPPVGGAWRVAVRGALVAAVVASIVMASACGAGEPARRATSFSGVSMGTGWTVTVVTGPEGLSGDEHRAIDDEIAATLGRIDTLMSTWQPASELSRFNASDDLLPFPVAPETFEMFQWAQRLSDETGGTLDASVAPLVEAWGFGPASRDRQLPDEATIARLRQTVGMALIELDPAGHWVRKRRPGVRVDFSAFAPGYGADRVAAHLTARGLTDYLIDVSGELVARGRNADGRIWQVGVERPQAEGIAVAHVVPLQNRAMATSGDYRNFREVDGQRLSHVLDPRTGRPARHDLASVTVFDDLAVRADGLATALLVLGPDEGPAFAEQHGLPALFLIRRPDGRFDERTTTAFEALDAAAAPAP